MKVTVFFHSYFRDLAGCTQTEQALNEGGSLGDLMRAVRERFPKLKSMERSTLVAVGVEYQPPEYLLNDGEEVSLFPPVQGG